MKSLGGERLESLAIGRDGAEGDRAFGILDQASDRVLTARREPRLLHAAAVLTADGEPQITLPDGSDVLGMRADSDARLSAWLGRAVKLVAAAERPPMRAEFFKDATDDASAAIEWTMPPGRFVDAAALLVLTTAGLRAGAEAYPAGDWDPRRFRANLLVEADGAGWLEDSWCGGAVRVGDVELAPRRRCIRCTMVTRAQPGVPKDIDIYKALSRTHAGDAGVWCAVTSAGTVRVGDALEVFPSE